MNLETPNVPEKKENEGKIIVKELNDAWSKLRTELTDNKAYADYFSANPDIKDLVYDAVKALMDAEVKADLRSKSQKEKDELSPEVKTVLGAHHPESL